MKFDIAALIDGAQKALSAVQTLAPLAGQIGGPGVAHVATIAISTAAVIENALVRVEGVKNAMTEQDEAKLRAMLAELQTVNDGLNGQIASS